MADAWFLTTKAWDVRLDAAVQETAVLPLHVHPSDRLIRVQTTQVNVDILIAVRTQAVPPDVVAIVLPDPNRGFGKEHAIFEDAPPEMGCDVPWCCAARCGATVKLPMDGRGTIPFPVGANPWETVVRGGGLESRQSLMTAHDETRCRSATSGPTRS